MLLDGSPMQLKDIHEVKELLSKQLEHGPAITQVDHPLCFRPYYMVHPCRTKEFMDLLIKNKQDYDHFLITWLSTVASSIGLEVDNRLFCVT